MLHEDDVLPREPNRHFCQHFMRRTTEQTFSAINLSSQQETTKLCFFSSQVRKQFKLLAAPFKSLRCCLRSDNALVSGKPRTPIPGECRALAGDFSGF